MPPAFGIDLRRIVHALGVIAVPVRAFINPHVVANQNNSPCTKLNSQVQGVETTVTAPAQLTELIKQKPVAISNQRNGVQPPFGIRRITVLGNS